MDNDDPSRTPASPWRQPVVWLIVALLAAAVAGGAIMIYVAGGDGATDTAPDTVRRTAQIQDADLGPDASARQRKLSAIVRVDAKRELVQVLPVSGDFDRAAGLRLSLRHPVRSSADRTLLLPPSALGWQAPARIDGGHDWNLQLDAGDGQWRLRGRLPQGQQAARLAPALQAP